MGLDLNDYDFENPIGFDGETSEFGGLKNLGKKISTGVKTVGKNIKAGAKDFIKNPIKAVGHLAKDTGKNVAKGFVKVAQFTMKVMPLTLAGRGGFLFIMARNGFGLADRLAPLYLADGDPILRKYKPEAIKQVRDKRYNIENAWKNMGGEINPFKKAILDGRGRPPRIFKKGDKSFDGTQYPYSVTFDGNYEYFGSEPNYDMFDGEVYTYFDGEQYVSEHKSNFIEPVVTSALIGAGMTVITTFIGLLKSNKVPEQPFADATPEAKAIGTMPTSASQIDPNAPILSPDGLKVIDPNTGETFNTSDVVKAGVEISKQTNPDGSPTNPDGSKKDAKFLGMPRKVGIGVTIGVSVLAVAGIIFAVVKSRK
jgi:hypothetical protein